MIVIQRYSFRRKPNLYAACGKMAEIQPQAGMGSSGSEAGLVPLWQIPSHPPIGHPTPKVKPGASPHPSTLAPTSCLWKYWVTVKPTHCSPLR